MKHMNKASSPKVAELALVGAALTKQTVTEIAHRLQDDSSGLTALDLSHASIGATGCKILEAGIRKATKMHGHSAKGGLVSLKLSHNKIGSAGVQCLVRVLVQARNASLLRLDVSSNEITDAGAGELAELVAQHPTPRAARRRRQPLRCARHGTAARERARSQKSPPAAARL